MSLLLIIDEFATTYLISPPSVKDMLPVAHSSISASSIKDKLPMAPSPISASSIKDMVTVALIPDPPRFRLHLNRTRSPCSILVQTGDQIDGDPR